MVPVVFTHKQTSIEPVMCVVDSGADMSYFDLDLASELGLTVKELKRIDSWDITGHIFWGCLSDVNVVIGGHEFKIPAIFSDQITRPFCVLGQEGLFDQARITFERYKWNIDIRPRTDLN